MKSAAKAVFSCFLLSAAVLGQSSTAQISGAVKDQTGALLPGAEITATQTADNKLAPSGAQGFVAYLNRAAFQNPALGTLGRDQAADYANYADGRFKNLLDAPIRVIRVICGLIPSLFLAKEKPK